MNDQLLAWIRVGVTAAIGATLNAWLVNLGVLDAESIAAFSSSVQMLVTIAVYVGITLAAQKWPIINRFLSLFLSGSGPRYLTKEEPRR